MHMSHRIALIGFGILLSLPLFSIAQSAAACPALTYDLRLGSRDATTGGQVTELQKFLSDYYGLNRADYVSGYFGPLTLKNVIRFQIEQGVVPAVGYVGPLTRAAIARSCGGTPAPVSAAAQSCSTPWGTTIVHGGYVYAAKASTAAQCEWETRTCSNGALSGTYQYQNCTTTVQSDVNNASCTAPWGATVLHNSTILAYQASSAVQCASEYRSCQNGTLSGGYQYPACSVQEAAPNQPASSCTLDGVTKNNGESYTFYAATVAEKCSEVAQTRTCQSGVFSGNPSYQYWKCDSSTKYGANNHSFSVAPSSGPTPFTTKISYNRMKPGFYVCAAYSITWGDGSAVENYPRTDECGVTPIPVKEHSHTYSQAGTYTITLSLEQAFGPVPALTTVVRAETGAGASGNSPSVTPPGPLGSAAVGSCIYKGQHYPEGFVKTFQVGEFSSYNIVSIECDNGVWLAKGSSELERNQNICERYPVAAAGNVLDDLGCATKGVRAALNVGPHHGAAPLTVSAYTSYGYAYNNYVTPAYTFSWGDGSTETVPSCGSLWAPCPLSSYVRTHTYAAPGSYTISMTDYSGRTNTASIRVDAGSSASTGNQSQLASAYAALSSALQALIQLLK